MLALALLLAAAAPAPAQVAASQCAPLSALDAWLRGEAFREAPVALARWLAPSGRVYTVRLYVNRDSGSWTILAVQPSGVACIIALGDRWRPWPGDS